MLHLCRMTFRVKLYFIIQVWCVSPVMLLAIRLWGGEAVWYSNSRHCGLEAGTLLLIRIKWWMLALQF